jgi:hypothetical protein
MTDLAISYSPHVGQLTLTLSIVVAICSALVPQTGQFLLSMANSIGCEFWVGFCRISRWPGDEVKVRRGRSQLGATPALMASVIMPMHRRGLSSVGFSTGSTLKSQIA